MKIFLQDSCYQGLARFARKWPNYVQYCKILVGEIATLLLGRRRTGFLVGGFFHGKILGNGLFSSLIPPSKCSLQIRVLAVTVNVRSLEIVVSHMRRTVLSCGNLSYFIPFSFVFVCQLLQPGTQQVWLGMRSTERTKASSK